MIFLASQHLLLKGGNSRVKTCAAGLQGSRLLGSCLLSLLLRAGLACQLVLHLRLRGSSRGGVLVGLACSKVP